MPAFVMNAMYSAVPLLHIKESDLRKLGEAGSLVQSLKNVLPALFVFREEKQLNLIPLHRFYIYFTSLHLAKHSPAEGVL